MSPNRSKDETTVIQEVSLGVNLCKCKARLPWQKVRLHTLLKSGCFIRPFLRLIAFSGQRKLFYIWTNSFNFLKFHIISEVVDLCFLYQSANPIISSKWLNAQTVIKSDCSTRAVGIEHHPIWTNIALIFWFIKFDNENEFLWLIFVLLQVDELDHPQ